MLEQRQRGVRQILMAVTKHSPFPIKHGGDLALRFIEHEVAAAIIAVDQRNPVNRGRVADQPFVDHGHQRFFFDAIFLPDPTRRINLPDHGRVGTHDGPVEAGKDRGIANREVMDPGQIFDELRGQLRPEHRTVILAQPGHLAGIVRRLGRTGGKSVDHRRIGQERSARVHPERMRDRDSPFDRPDHLEFPAATGFRYRSRRLHPQDQWGYDLSIGRPPFTPPVQVEQHLQFGCPARQPSRIRDRDRITHLIGDQPFTPAYQGFQRNGLKGRPVAAVHLARQHDIDFPLGREPGANAFDEGSARMLPDVFVRRSVGHGHPAFLLIKGRACRPCRATGMSDPRNPQCDCSPRGNRFPSASGSGTPRSTG